MGSKGSAPDSPNYIGAAEEQGLQNRLSFLSGLNATRINQVGPYGSQTWKYTGPAAGSGGTSRGDMPTWDTYAANIGKHFGAVGGDAYQDALGQIERGSGMGATAIYDQSKRDLFNSPYTEAMARKEYERALDAWNNAGQTGGAAGTNSPGSWTLETTLSPEMQKIYDMGYGRYIAAANGMKKPLNTSGLVERGDWNKLTQALSGDGSQYTDAYYDKATRLLGDKYSREEQSLRSQLLNSGVMEGSEAYKSQMGDWMNAKNSNYADIADQAILTGSTLRNQDIGSLVSALTSQDNARAKNLEELTYLRNLPLAEAQTILSGLQVPQFSGGSGSGGGGPAPTDYMGALSNQFNADMNRYNADAAQSAQTAQTGISLAALAAMFAGASDRRLKTNIKPLGRTNSRGFQLYSYEKYGEPEVGLMADEVQAILPEAVSMMPSGYLCVNYTLAGGV